MALPESIPVRFTEEEAGYLSVRPVRRQEFRLEQLVDMVLAVTGRDAGRIRRILRAGTVVYHDYRYWWEGFAVGEGELETVLARFPAPAPERPFRAGECAAAVFESGGTPPRMAAELRREVGSRRRLLRRRNFWQALMELAAAAPPEYLDYSYERRADLYVVPLDQASAARLIRAAEELAPRALRAELAVLRVAARMVLVCPRG